MKRLLLATALLTSATLALLLLRRSADPMEDATGKPLLGQGLSRDAAYACREGEAMGTRFAVCLPRATLEENAKAVLAEVRRIEALASEWRDASPLSLLNRGAGGGAQPLPPELFTLIAKGLELGRVTGGAFDVSWAAMRGVWRFGRASPRVPPRARVLAARELVDYRRVEIDARSRAVRLPLKGMALGLGGIAKGYALARAAALLRARGIDSFLLSAGGQVLVGAREDRPWRVGIRDPRGVPDARIATLELREVSVATSGDYERYFVHEGRRYHHVIDPRTGYPTRGLRSATVICKDATRADALSTALMVLGLEKGRALLERLKGVEAVFVDAAGRLSATPGMAASLRTRP